MSGFTLAADPATEDRRRKWAVFFAHTILSQDLSAADRIAILAMLLGREVGMLPLEQVAPACCAVGAEVGGAVDGTLVRRPDYTLYAMPPAGCA